MTHYLSDVDENGVSKEPFEEVTVDVDPEYQGMVIENMSNRNGNITELKVTMLYRIKTI